MAKRVDWMDFAHLLRKEREAMQDQAPNGVEVSLHLMSYRFGGADFSVHLAHDESGSSGSGSGSTPAKALEAAKKSLAKEMVKKTQTPRLVAAKPAAIEG